MRFSLFLEVYDTDSKKITEILSLFLRFTFSFYFQFFMPMENMIIVQIYVGL